MSGLLKGIIPAMLTPIGQDDTIDREGLKRLARFVSRDGIDIVFVLGYAGEVFSLCREDRRQVIELTRETIEPGKTIISGIMGNSLEQMTQYAQDAYEAGANYVLATPTNFLGLQAAEIVNLFTELADRSKLPLIVYNCPENVQTITPDIMARLSRHPNIAGLKQTSDFIELEEMMFALEGAEAFTVISGNEYIYLGALALGIDAYMMGGPGNVFPQTCLRIYRAYKEGRVEEARAEHMRMTKFLMELYALPVNAVASLKGMLEMEGICPRYMKLPSLPPDEAMMAQIKALMIKHKVEVD